MPDRNDPYGLLSNPVEKPVGVDIHFAIGQVRELGNERGGVGKLRQSLERFLG
jgi:hypothetical protein